MPRRSFPIRLALIAFACWSWHARSAAASPPAYSQVQRLNNPAVEDGDMFGHSVALLGDNLVVGSTLTNLGGTSTGAAYLFDPSAKLLQTFQQPNPAAGDWFGNEVAAVGSNVLIGDLGDDTAAHDAGAAFLMDPNTGKVLLSLQSPNPHDGDWFGASVAAAGQNLLIGAPLEHVGSVSAGGAYLFDGTSGKLLQSFHEPNPADGDWFGVSMALAGKDVLVGAFLNSTGAQAAGAAYLFDSQTGALLHTFQKPQPAANDQFGIWVAAMGNTLLIGAPHDSTAAADAGAVYLFDATSYQPLSISPLRNPTPTKDELFGSSLAIAGSNILVGAPGQNGQHGAAYLFDGQTGKLIQSFQDDNPSGDDMFGLSMDASADRLLIGAPGDHSGSNLGGAAFLFK